MDSSQILEGELLAYLDGVDLPHVAQALSKSADLQRKLDELRQLNTFFRTKLSNLDFPDPQDMVDVITGQATKQQALIVAAYRRNSPSGQREFEALKKEYKQLTGSKSQSEDSTTAAEGFVSNFMRRLPLPVFVARPVLNFVGLKSSMGLRSSKSPDVLRASREQDVEQVFEVTELDAQVALRIPRVQGELYELTGTVTQDAQLVENTRVTLRGTRGSVRRRMTDEAGFFAFRKLPPETYRLRITREDGVILIPSVMLAIDESPGEHDRS